MTMPDRDDVAAQLAAVTAELDALSYAVSHDLRAPLRAVEGFSRIVMEDYAADLPEDARAYLDDVRGAALRMGRMIDALVVFSRLNRQPLFPRVMDHADTVRQCIAEVVPPEAAGRVDVRVGELLPGRADPDLIRLVWLALLGNAVKFTGARAAAVIEVGSRPRPAGPEYFVRDNGVGFEMQYADKLFGLFQRMHRAEEFPGVGADLAVARRIVARHGGRMWAEAALDHGATFHFSLPPAEPVHG